MMTWNTQYQLLSEELKVPKGKKYLVVPVKAQQTDRTDGSQNMVKW